MTSFTTQYNSVVMDNLRNSVEDFKSGMKEILRDKPSVGGEIAGMDFQQFSLSSAMYNLVEMQDSVDDKRLRLSQEEQDQIKLWALQMESEAKRILGENYDKWHERAAESYF